MPWKQFMGSLRTVLNKCHLWISSRAIWCSSLKCMELNDQHNQKLCKYTRDFSSGQLKNSPAGSPNNQKMLLYQKWPQRKSWDLCFKYLHSCEWPHKCRSKRGHLHPLPGDRDPLWPYIQGSPNWRRMTQKRVFSKTSALKALGALTRYGRPIEIHRKEGIIL